MALSVVTYAAVVVDLQDRGPVDGSPATLSVTTVTTLARRISIANRVNKRISVAGFSTTDSFRPGKTMWEITLEILIAYSGRTSLTAGNYGQVEFTAGSNAEVKYCGMIESTEDDVNDESEAVQRIVIVGPVDGGTTS